MSASYGVLRDASGYRTHRQTIGSDPDTWHIPKYHVPADSLRRWTACGREAAEFTAKRVENIPTSRRCQRPGCKQEWPQSDTPSRGRSGASPR